MKILFTIYIDEVISNVNISINISTCRNMQGYFRLDIIPVSMSK